MNGRGGRQVEDFVHQISNQIKPFSIVDISHAAAGRASSRLSSVSSSVAMSTVSPAPTFHASRQQAPLRRKENPSSAIDSLKMVSSPDSASELSPIQESNSSAGSSTSLQASLLSLSHSSESFDPQSELNREILKWKRKAQDADDAALVMKHQMQDSLSQMVELEQRLQQQHQNFMEWHREEMDRMVIQYEGELQRYREMVCSHEYCTV